MAALRAWEVGGCTESMGGGAVAALRAWGGGGGGCTERMWGGGGGRWLH